MQNNRIMTSIFAWCMSLVTMMIMGGLFAYAGCQPGNEAIPVNHGIAGGALWGLVIAWTCGLAVYFNWPTEKKS